MVKRESVCVRWAGSRGWVVGAMAWRPVQVRETGGGVSGGAEGEGVSGDDTPHCKRGVLLRSSGMRAGAMGTYL